MDDSTLWKAVPHLALSTYVFDDQIAVYDDYTGSTFLLDEVTVTILTSLGEKSRSLAGVIESLRQEFSLTASDVDTQFVVRALENLQRSGLVERVRA
jgi:PqqD family protein of HPr-rel-A system